MLKFSICVLLLTYVALILGQTGKPRSLKPKLLPRKKGDLQAAAGHFQSYKGFPYHDSSFSNSIGYSHSQPAHYQPSGGWCGSGFGGYQSSGGGGGGYGGFEGHGYSSSPGWSSPSHDMGYGHGGHGQGSYGYGGHGWSSPMVSYAGGGHGYESQGYMSHEPHYGPG